MRKQLSTFALLAALLTAASVEPAAAQQHAGDDAWPMYIECGDRTPPKKGLELVDDLNAIRQAWKFKRHMSVGKGLYPGMVGKARKLGLKPFQGGASSPVIADGKVFVSYYKPNGKAPAKVEGWRTMGSSEKLMMLPDWFFSVTADDILVCLDAETGKLLWERVEKGKGLNRLSHKRSHWGVSPACHEGTVFHLGSMGILYATRIKDGKELWETHTDPHLEKIRKEHIDSEKLCWDSADRSSLIVAEGVVIVPRGRLHAYGLKDGKHRWSTRENVISGYATPTLWRHKGRTYVLANTGEGTIRLIDPKDGSIIWTWDKLGPFLGTMSVTGDLVILNGGTKKGEEDNGLFAMYRLGLDGPRQLWQLPDRPEYRHNWPKDSGPRQKVCIRDGLAYIPLWPHKLPKGFPSQRLIVADAETGKIHTETPYRCARSGARPLLLEDKLLMVHDDAHSDPIRASWWTAGRDPKQLTGDSAFPHVAITAYTTPIVQPYRNGRLYFRSLDGLVCYDFRKPTKGEAPSLHLTIPSELTGPRGDLHVSLYTEKGSITRGGVRGGDFLHDVDVSKIEWDGQTLRGKLGIDLPRTRKAEWYSVDARVLDSGKITGTVTLHEKGLPEPIEVKGDVHTMKHQPAWQPSCEYVLLLDGASINVKENRKRLLLFVPKMDAWADQTTKTRPVVYPRKLNIKDGKISGTIDVRYRADKWTTPLVGEGATTAATYTFEATLKKGDNRNVGTYKGTYGVEWSRTMDLTGRLEE